LFSRSICSALSSMRSAAMFSSTRATRLVPGIAYAVGKIAQIDGDYTTAVQALTLHRRSAPTDPLHCTYSLGVGVIAQGAKQVMLGDEVINYSPGRSRLTTIDLPVVSHVTQASVRNRTERL
jgi:hypothetical protein